MKTNQHRRHKKKREKKKFRLLERISVREQRRESILRSNLYEEECIEGIERRWFTLDVVHRLPVPIEEELKITDIIMKQKPFKSMSTMTIVTIPLIFLRYANGALTFCFAAKAL